MSNPRTDYLPIVDREGLRLPGDARVVVWIILNIEEWEITGPMARTVLPPPQGASLIPDITNYGWQEYGLRVGFWRLRELFERLEVPVTVALNGNIFNSYPRVGQAIVQSGWEIIGHGFVQRALPLEADEVAVVRQTVETIKEHAGYAPRGWLGPGLAETFETPDVLAAEGIEYVCDWTNDALPYRMKVRSGELYSVPYTLELNDIPMYIIQHHRSPEIFERTRDQFDTLYREGASVPRIMAIAVHPYITGVPHRIGYLEQALDYIRGHDKAVFMTGSQILDWYKGASKD